MGKNILLSIIICAFNLVFAETFTEDSLKYKFQDITIIGQNKQEVFLDNPTSINRIDIAETESRRINFNDVLKMSPGVIVQDRNGGPLSKIIIRGTGSRSNDPQIQGIRILVDGFPETDPDGRTSLDLVDLSSISNIEIRRTNSSAIFGANSGGVINFVTNTTFDRSYIQPKSTFGSFGFNRNEFTSGFRLGNSVISFSGSNTNFSGWRDHSDSYSTYFNLSFKNKLDDNSELFLSASGVSSLYKLSGPLTLEQLNSNPVQANTTYLNRDERRHNKFLRIGFNFTKGFSDGHSLNIMGYINPKIIMRSQKNSYRNFNRYNLGGRIEYSYTHKFTENAKNILAIGIDDQYQNGTVLFYSLNSENQRGTILKQNKEEGGHNYGVYFQDEIIINKFNFLFGGRYSVADYLYDDFIKPQLKTSKSFESFTPSIGISYKLSSISSMFLNYSMGVENPAFNEIDPPSGLDTLVGLNPLLSPMKSHSLEAGLKGIMLVDQNIFTDINYEIVGYIIQNQNELIPYETDGVSYYVSAGKTRKYGLETAFTLNTSYNISLGASLSLSNNKFLSFNNNSQSFDNKLIPGIPSQSMNLKLGYYNPIGFSVSTSFEYLGNIPIDNSNTIYSDAYTIIKINTSYSMNLGSMKLNLFLGIDNLLDKSYVSSIFVNGSNGELYEPGLPRNIYGGVRINFGL